MKTIGLIGGMSWESSLHYYRLINEGVKARLGGLHSAELLLRSLDFAPLARLQTEERWDEIGLQLAEAARSVERAGADLLLLCTNTMHRVAPAIEAAVGIPLLHIADATAAAVAQRRLRRVALLGTRFTMEQPFYRQRLAERHGLDVITPGDADRERIHRIIYDELCLGRVEATSRRDLQRIAAALVAAGAEGIVSGCTEIMMLLGPDDVSVPLFDTTALHATAAVDLALG